MTDGGEFKSNGTIWDLADAIKFCVHKKRYDKLQSLSEIHHENFGDACNYKDKDGNVALVYALGPNQVEYARLLLESAADPNVENNYRTSAWELAIRGGNPDVLRVLFENGLVVKRSELEDFVGSDDICARHMEVINDFLPRKVDNAKGAQAAGKV